MANVLDLRRRIRSVKNTRQITKAMKMVSAAKLRRAQERAMKARPYAQMLTNVLVSLVRRTELYSELTGEILHSLLVEREEKNVLVIVVAGDKGFAGSFNSNIGKAAQRFIEERRTKGQNVDIEPVGKKAVGLYKKRYRAGNYERLEQKYDNELSTHFETIRHRMQAGERSKRLQEGERSIVQPEAGSAAGANGEVEVVFEHPALLAKVDFDEITAMSRGIVERYERTEIDSVYLVYNEFKSVISQRVVVEKLLPIRKLGSQEITAAEEMTEEQREAAARAAQSSGISINEPEDEAAEQEAKKFGTAEVDYIFDQAPEKLVNHLMPRYVATQIFHALLESVAAEHAARMTATDAATNAAGDLIDSLSLTMNRARQAAITKEIIEIVSGAAAL